MAARRMGPESFQQQLPLGFYSQFVDQHGIPISGDVDSWFKEGVQGSPLAKRQAWEESRKSLGICTTKQYRYILITALCLLLVMTAVLVPVLVGVLTRTTPTTTCQNRGILLSNGSCACNNYTTDSYCQTPLCLVAGSLSTTCLNGGTCTYSTSTSTSTCSCVSSSWTGSYCQTPLCPNCNYNCGHGSCNSPSSCYCNSGYQGTCCNSIITSGQCLSLIPASITSWGGGFNNTWYGHEHDVLNASCSTGKTLTVASCFYGINSATPGCTGSTASASCFSMDVSLTCMTLCNPTYCYFAIENTNFNDTCIGQLKTFWMYFTCS